MTKYSHIILIILLTCTYNSQALTIYAQQNGNWNDAGTWFGGVIPDADDHAVINGYIVTVDDSDGDINVDQITLANSFTASVTRLRLTGSVTVTSNAFNAKIGVNYQDVEVLLEGSSRLIVNGPCDFRRSGLNNTSAKLQLFMSSKASMQVTDDFSFEYDDSGNSENNAEIYLSDSTELDILGDLTVIISDGEELTINVFDDAKLSVGDSLKMEKSGGKNLLLYTDSSSIVRVYKSVILNNSGGTGMLSVSANQGDGKMVVKENIYVINSIADEITGWELNKGSTLDVDGDIIFDAKSDGDVYLTLNDKSILQLGGSFLRSNTFGSLFMGSSSTLVYDGTGDQQIACTNMPGSGTDNFICTNIEFDNSSGNPITLEGDWTVSGDLNLNDGIIQTADTALLIIADSASISGGSTISYVEGPMRKVGRSKSSTFVFPTGHNGVYAPIEVEAVADPSYEYQAQYFSCPPPIEDGLEPPLENISGQGYWSLSKSAGAPDLDITLHWSDAAAAGIDNPDSLLVAGLKDNGVTKVWTSYGNGGTTGGTGNGVSGTVMNNFSEPPPMDEVTLLTLGSTDIGANALPVILLSFSAQDKTESIQLDWTTIMEEDTDYFTVEHSANGRSFRAIGQVMARGTENGPQSYDFTDISPVPGVNYYRLKQVDYNGNYQYSPVVSAAIDQRLEALEVLPNLVRDEVTIRGIDANTNEVKVEIFNAFGQQVYSGIAPVRDGTLQLFIRQTGVYQTGWYQIVVRAGHQVKSAPFIFAE